MAGLLSDVLPFLYSQGDRLKRQLGGLLSDPVGSVEQTLGGLLDAAAVQRALSDKAFANKQRPFQVTDKQALGQMADNMLAGPLSFAPAGITVWHGSPHKFDKFDSSKIGTGEGAQAYGHGLYLAESPEVADGYRKALSKNVSVNGAKLQTIPSDGPLAEAHNMTVRNIQNGMSPTDAISATHKYWSDAASEMQSFAKDNPQLADRIQKEVLSRMQVSDAAKTLKPESFYLDPGSLYKVDLPDEHVAKMLDWDKPLSQQHPDTRLALEALRDSARKSFPAIAEGDPTGRGIYSAYQGHRGGNQAAASDALRELGVPGIRYLDGGSRGAGQGTSNFVVFPGNEDILKIIERNGVPLETVAPKFTYPQEQALETARQNAVKMLGLPENNTAMDRARALGFTERNYSGVHEAPTSAADTSAPLFNMSKTYPDDIYSPMAARYYGDGVNPARDADVARRIQAMRNKPDAPAVVFRAVPKEAGDYINHGDWVSLDKQYAIDHGEGALNGEYKILRDRVPAKTLFTEGNSLYEFGLDKTQKFAEGPASMPTMIGADPKKTPFERAKFAAFDPARVNENDLLGKADPALLAALGIGTGAALTDEDVRKFLQSLTTP